MTGNSVTGRSLYASATQRTGRPQPGGELVRQPTAFGLFGEREHRLAISLQRHDAIAHAAHVADELGRYLAPQMVQVHLDAVAAHPFLPAVDCVLELLARHYRARFLHERLQYRELARRKLDRRAAEGDQPHRGVEGERAAGHAGPRTPFLAPDHRARPREQLVEIER